MTTRRGFFGLLAGALAAPYIPPVPVAPLAPVLPMADAEIRADLADAIYDINPTDTPFLSAKKRKRRKGRRMRHVVWQGEALVAR